MTATDTGEHNHWIRLDTAAELLGVGERRTLELAKSEHWRTHRPRQGDRTREYLAADVIRTRHQRKAQQ